jgi:hypothetical protein
MTAAEEVVCLLDVDHTLLEDDRMPDDLGNPEWFGDLLDFDFPALVRPARAVDAEQETT